MSSELSNSFKQQLTGPNAFYTLPDYKTNRQKEFASQKTLPVFYTTDLTNKVSRITQQILDVICFPIGIYKLLHRCIGKLSILPASTPLLLKVLYPKQNKNAQSLRSQIDLKQEGWEYKRLTIAVDGYHIDATILGKPSTLGNGRWMLYSNGQQELYEEKLSNEKHGVKFRQILSKIEGNAIIFNYPGVGSSSGLPSKQAMTKAYLAMLKFLEDDVNGIGAKQIIGYGYSMGGAVQGEALKAHTLKEGINYVFVKDRTFSDLSKTAASWFKPNLLTYLINQLLSSLVKILGWNMNTTVSSKKLEAPEIIMQTAKVENYTILENSSLITHDKIIASKASLAKALLDDKSCPKTSKTFIGMKETHNSTLISPDYIAQHILNHLPPAAQTL